MVNAQEWLISNIPIEQKSQVKQIYIHLESHGSQTANRRNEGYYQLLINKKLQLEGELAVDNWTKLDHLAIRGGNWLNTDKTTTIRLVNLRVSNCPKLNSVSLYLTDCQTLTVKNLAILTSLRINNNNQLTTININSVPNLHTMNLTDYFNSSQREQQRVNDLNQLNHLISPNTSYNFQTLQQELKRLKIQDLTIQIPLKKQELEQLTSTAQEKLTRAERYPLEKLLKKHSKVLQNNSNLEKINELKEILSEKLTNEEAQNLLNKQKEIFNLEKHLGNLRTEQVAQIQQANLPSNS